MNHPNSRSGIDVALPASMGVARGYPLCSGGRHSWLCSRAGAANQLSQAWRSCRRVGVDGWLSPPVPSFGETACRLRSRADPMWGQKAASRRSSEGVLGRRQIVEMTGSEVAGRRGTQGWLLGAASLEGVGATGVKAAALGRVDRARHVALEDDALARRAGLRHRNSRQERLRGSWKIIEMSLPRTRRISLSRPSAGSANTITSCRAACASAAIILVTHDLGIVAEVAERVMVMYAAMTSLNPVLTVGRQLGETLRLHQRVSRRAADARAVEMLAFSHG